MYHNASTFLPARGSSSCHARHSALRPCPSRRSCGRNVGCLTAARSNGPPRPQRLGRHSRGNNKRPPSSSADARDTYNTNINDGWLLSPHFHRFLVVATDGHPISTGTTDLLTTKVFTVGEAVAVAGLVDATSTAAAEASALPTHAHNAGSGLQAGAWAAVGAAGVAMAYALL